MVLQHSRPQSVPPLASGDRLTRAEFERRYEATPEDFKAELIEGVVYVASPVRAFHGDPHFNVTTWLGVYSVATPGTQGSDNTTGSISTMSRNLMSCCELCKVEQHESAKTVTSKVHQN